MFIAACIFGLGAYAQHIDTDIEGDGNTVIVIVNNDDTKGKDKDEKDKKDKDKKDKDKDGKGNGNGHGKDDDKDKDGPLLAISENEVKTQVQVYPNPVADQLFVTNASVQATNYRLVNSEGAEVQKGVINGQTSFSVASLQRGVYTIQLLDPAQMVVYKNRVVIRD